MTHYTTPNDLVLTKRGLRFQGQYFPCTIGKGGISANKREGDGATPVGVHGIVGMLYRPDRIANLQIGPCPLNPVIYGLMIRTTNTIT